MALFQKRSTSNRTIPNYNTVPATDGPVIDVFSLDGEGYNTVNASNGYLLLSGIRYWNMQVNAYGCRTDVNVARCNASRFFSRLWDNGYYTEQPGIGWYIALDTVFHDNSWSDLSKKAMGVWCEHVLNRDDVDLHELWYTAMVYTTFCGGSIEQVVAWLHRSLEKTVTQNSRRTGCSHAMTLLKHYRMLLDVTREDPFTAPEMGGDLRGYWNHIANKYVLQEALLEGALAEAFKCHDPYKMNINDLADGESSGNREFAASWACAALNKAAREGNLPALSVCSLATWVYDSTGNKMRYPSYAEETHRLDSYIIQNRDNVFPQLYDRINVRAEEVIRTAKSLQEAETLYATGLYHYSIHQPEEAARCMQQAAAYKDALAGIRWPEDKLNPVLRAELWLQRHRGEAYAVSDDATDGLNEIETRSDTSFTNPSEIRYRRMGEYLRDGYLGMQPRPELWEKLREKALSRGNAMGIVLYTCDEEPELARDFFRSILDDTTDKWNQPYRSFAWMGLAWLRHLQGDYSTVEEALQFLQLNPKAQQLFPNIRTMAASAARGATDVLETFASAFCFDKKYHTNHPVMKGLGQIFARHLCLIYEEEFRAARNEIVRRKAFDRWIRTEFLYTGICDKTVNLVKQGLEIHSVETYGLLRDSDELFGILHKEFGTSRLYDHVQNGIQAGVALYERSDFLKNEIDELERWLQEKREQEEEAHRRKMDELTRPSSSDDSGSSLVDVLFDAWERKENDGLTNEELYNRGLRSEYDHERDEEIRAGWKNPWGLF